MLILVMAVAASSLVQAPCVGALRLVTVTGAAEVHVAPDRAVVRLGVDTTDTVLSKAVAENQARSERVLKLIRSLGIAAEHIQTDYLAIGPEDRSDRSGNRSPIFRADRQITVILEQVNQIERLVGGALEAGATTIAAVSFETKDPKRHRDQARSLAIQAAKDKASRLASEMGAKLGAVQSITEERSSPWGWAVQSNVNVRSVEGTSAEQPTATISPGQVTIKAIVEIAFQLE